MNTTQFPQSFTDQNIQNYIEYKKELQQTLLDYLDTIEENENEYYLLIHQINEINNNNDLLEFFRLFVIISNNYQQNSYFYEKILKILIYFKEKILQIFSESTIFRIFKSNKRIILFLFEEKILTPNKYYADLFSKDEYYYKGYYSYFYPEIEPFLSTKLFFRGKEEYETEKEIFLKKRKISGNDNHICHLIRNDLIEEFVSYTTKSNYPLDSKIEYSFYETNQFLIDQRPTLIEYASFYGSIQIFKYLQFNGVDLTQSIWLYAIHGKNSDIIHALEEFHINPVNDNFNECFYEAIKCHHNDIADYLKANYLKDEQEDINDLQKEEEDNNNNEEEKEDDNNNYYRRNIICPCKTYSKTTKKSEIENDKVINIYSNNKISHYALKYFNYKYWNNEIYLYNVYYICKYNYPSFLEVLIHSKEFKFVVNSIFLKKKRKKETRRSSYFYIEELNTLLFIATKSKNIEIINILLSIPEIDVNLNSSKHIWKHDYVNIDNLNNIKWLKNLTYDPDIDGNYESRHEKVKIYTALNYSFKKQNLEIIKLLLSHPKMNPNVKTINKKWSFESCEEKRRECIEYIIEYENTSLMNSILNDNFEIFQLLLTNPNTNINETSLYKKINISTEYGKRKEVSIDEINSTALSFSIKKNKFEYVQLLLSQPKIDVCFKIIEKYIFSGYIADFYFRPYQLHDWLIDSKIEEFDKYECITEAFHIAIYCGNLQIIQLLLTRPEIDVNANAILKMKGKIEEETTLHIASINGNFEVFKIIYAKSNADINSNSMNILSHPYLIFNRKNIFHIAVAHGNVEFVKFLLSLKKLDINAYTSDMKSPLYLSIYHYNGQSSLEILKLLLSQPSIDVNAKNDYHYYNTQQETALICAVKDNKIECVKILLSHPKININEPSYIHINETKKVKIKTCLHISLKNGYHEISELLLSHPNIDTSIKYVKTIEKEEGIILTEEKNILILALKNKKLKSLYNSYYYNGIYSINKDALQSYGPEIDKRLEIFKLILSFKNIDINEKLIQNYGDNRIVETPLLHKIIEINDVKLLEFILSNPDIDVNAKYIKKTKNMEVIKTALHLVVENHKPKLLKCLLSNPNIDINAKMHIKFADCDNDGLTALHLAVNYEYIEIVKLLLSHPKIDVNIQLNKLERSRNIYSKNYYLDDDEKLNQMYGVTALHLAVYKGYDEIVHLLLSNPKIDVNIKFDKIIRNKSSDRKFGIIRSKKPKRLFGMTALHLAVKNNNITILQYLLSNEKIDLNIKMDKIEYIKTVTEFYQLYKILQSMSDTQLYNLMNGKRDLINGDYVYQTYFGMTALHLAIKKNSTEMIQCLLSNKNIDINLTVTKIINEKQLIEYPIHMIIENNNLQILQHLLSKKGIDINAIMTLTENGREYKLTPLHLASALNYKKLVSKLFSAGADFF